MRNVSFGNVRSYLMGKISKNIFNLSSAEFVYSVVKTSFLSTSLGKTFFAWRFILNENILF